MNGIKQIPEPGWDHVSFFSVIEQLTADSTMKELYRKTGQCTINTV